MYFATPDKCMKIADFPSFKPRYTIAQFIPVHYKITNKYCVRVQDFFEVVVYSALSDTVLFSTNFSDRLSIISSIDIFGDMLAVLFDTRTISIWSLITKQEVCRIEASATAPFYGNPKLSSTHLYTMTSAEHDSHILKYDLQTGELVAVLQGHTASLSAISIGKSCIISVGNDNTWRMWDLHTDKLLLCTATPTLCFFACV